MSDILSLAASLSQRDSSSNSDGYVLCVGSKGSGKTALLSALSNGSAQSEATTSTVGFYYKCLKRDERQATHVWELGGGHTRSLQELASIVITPQRLGSNAVVFVFDLSDPTKSLLSAARWLPLLHARAAECATKRRAKPDDAAYSPAAVMRAGWARRSSSDASTTAPPHPDEQWLKEGLLPIPAIVVGTKWDTLKQQDVGKRRAVLAALRYTAHIIGASVLCVSTKDRSSLAPFRAMLDSCNSAGQTRNNSQLQLQQQQLPAASSFDVSKPLFIPAGSDCLEDIGPPLQIQGIPAPPRVALQVGPLPERLQRYAQPLEIMFGQPATPREQWLRDAGSAEATAEAESEALLPAPSAIDPGSELVIADWPAIKYPEPLVDGMRAQRAAELARTVREQERKLRLEAAAAAAAAPSSSGRKL